MNVENGEIFSISAKFIQFRADLSDKKYINKITKGVYELGSIFKALSL